MKEKGREGGWKEMGWRTRGKRERGIKGGRERQREVGGMEEGRDIHTLTYTHTLTHTHSLSHTHTHTHTHIHTHSHTHLQVSESPVMVGVQAGRGMCTGTLEKETCPQWLSMALLYEEGMSPSLWR